jgi:hypothetical protein
LLGGALSPAIRTVNNREEEIPTMIDSATRPLVLGVALTTLLLPLTTLLLSVWPSSARAADVGQIKVSKGTVYIERAGQKLSAPAGTRISEADAVVTGADGSVGIAFLDASLLSAGPNSALVIDRFTFDSTTNQGAFETSLKRGTLSAVSGKIAKQSPDAMKVKTPVAILGARGTEFFVRTSETRN